jgi:hypothetical protein
MPIMLDASGAEKGEIKDIWCPLARTTASVLRQDPDTGEITGETIIVGGVNRAPATDDLLAGCHCIGNACPCWQYASPGKGRCLLPFSGVMIPT